MSGNENTLREQITFFGRSLFERGLTAGSSGNIGLRLEDGWLMTPTNCCLGNIDPADISRLDLHGNLLSGKAPSKEFFLHKAFLDHRPDDRAVVHLHSTYATAISCLPGIDPMNVLPPLTPYSIMRFGKVALTPYHRPGDKRLGDEIAKVASDYRAVLLANHGPIVAGKSLKAAVYAAEELEATAKLFMLLLDRNPRLLTPEQVDELNNSPEPQQSDASGGCC
ncbi:3-oxo-tetronate 4-phosphate decarboxylase [Marinobacterium lutimaris]|uniref:3-oxo-tetronate 4-phosphate decarboxylase n=1 Tax=Marinobacterium lutimaris TaxID=568106 RepID=A0A1H6DUV5_9GAMM|nr:3-oxo-tetronate 4-phosphate decarboxylase [Marinobacterium lutimaris]SEG89058.1 Ribulose-5-phosphate 4-epimerase/Fuculose-1-phosphate aldolase [Marinobacterium lutimaris]